MESEQLHFFTAPFLCPVLQAIKQGAGSILNDFEYYDKYK